MQEYVMSTEPFWKKKNWLEEMSVLKKCRSENDKATEVAH